MEFYIWCSFHNEFITKNSRTTNNPFFYYDKAYGMHCPLTHKDERNCIIWINTLNHLYCALYWKQVTHTPRETPHAMVRRMLNLQKLNTSHYAINASKMRASCDINVSHIAIDKQHWVSSNLPSYGPLFTVHGSSESKWVSPPIPGPG